jgi:hypothetical protein
MLEQIFARLPELYKTDLVKVPLSFYFSLDDVKMTVLLSPTSCLVTAGRTVTEADCVCKTSKDFFLRIWNEGYRPGLKDFFSGTIKSNNPDALRSFLISFGKEA